MIRIFLFWSCHGTHGRKKKMCSIKSLENPVQEEKLQPKQREQYQSLQEKKMMKKTGIHTFLLGPNSGKGVGDPTRTF